MHGESVLDKVARAIASTPVGDAKALAGAMSDSEVSLSARHMGRLLRQVLSPVELHSFDFVRDGHGRRLNPIVASAYDRFSRRRRMSIYFGQLVTFAGQPVLVLTDRRGSLLWARLDGATPEAIAACLQRVRDFVGGDFSLVPHGSLHLALSGLQLPQGIAVVTYPHSALPYMAPSVPRPRTTEHSHLDELEAESIRIIREAVAVARNPGMLFSMGKDSMVMWTLAKKAFYPEPPPFPLAVIDTRWKFQDMYQFRNYMSQLPEADVRVHVNPDAISLDVNPFDFGSARHTEITKTMALKQVLDKHKFDFVFGGARRDEEKSRAKERVFSVRNEKHGWDPKTQRPELWNVYNTFLAKGQSMRVFPLSNWTELDVWRYVEQEDIPVVPLYFASVRPFVERDGSLIMVDDERFRLEEGEEVLFDSIRFRTLGCYPLTGGVRSDATTIADIIRELEQSRVSERSSRVIDFDPGASMEQKKKDGYF
jgi:sulfate adenylyltransferase subunit 2